MHKILTSEVNLKFGVHVLFRFAQLPHLLHILETVRIQVDS